MSFFRLDTYRQQELVSRSCDVAFRLQVIKRDGKRLTGEYSGLVSGPNGALTLWASDGKEINIPLREIRTVTEPCDAMFSYL